jgi:2-C-methyl-D-erythritol 4-phosphate cytidylyltransferase
MGTRTAKAFLDLGGKPMVVHSLRTLSGVRSVASIVVVTHADQEGQATEVLHEHGPWVVPVQLVRGGAERQDSVAAGLDAVHRNATFVLVHDAARPFVSLSCAQACVDAAATHGAAIAAMASPDTVKLVDQDSVIVETLDRRRIWLAQTPQVFRASLLREAYHQASLDGFMGTDDAALFERLGYPVHIVPGEPTNRKITTPDDLRWAACHLQAHTGPGGQADRS